MMFQLSTPAWPHIYCTAMIPKLPLKPSLMNTCSRRCCNKHQPYGTLNPLPGIQNLDPGAYTSISFSKCLHVYLYAYMLTVYIYIYTHMCVCVGASGRASVRTFCVSRKFGMQQVRPRSEWRKGQTVVCLTQGLQSSSFVVMTSFLLRDYNILPKKGTTFEPSGKSSALA